VEEATEIAVTVQARVGADASRKELAQALKDAAPDSTTLGRCFAVIDGRDFSQSLWRDLEPEYVPLFGATEEDI